ncbi:phosphoglycerate mutase 1 [Candidatus Blochmanniella floridana]|uniref:2,3-bisphosphoglycerate-dependent phosphoglycerate mutase n=1 Tax=Blochmanniella floridana TaxID=203907 RepID=GPMA_BLOFL|nr:RecName: Full=2,3-bisphosphoglycerate-dependent phosphoglycerate mutase; Short=BPG-dependent PGAM; Short=PGAM; Short=Phosphoglyceromutase; Short=dPGM [Candidatus Blochmannia floridanus]CAD83409.1 phosphoglycerate mutase 1 [Candidatus Blochmannia floridanus]
MHIIKTVLIRHGESQWNKDNRFTGWIDVDLSNQGYSEAKRAGQLLKKYKFIFDYGYTSVLKRTIHTLWVILDQLNQTWLPIQKVWQLNERHYGALQGLNKNEAIKTYGYDTIQKWRRSFKDIPPKNNKNDLFLGTNDIRYKNIETNTLPNGESLELTANRVIPYWQKYIEPKIYNNNCIIIVAHGNSIRAILKFLNQLDDSEIFNIEIPTGIPLIYEFDNNIKPIRYYYLSE